MFVSFLSILVIIETIIILFGLVVFFSRKSSRLKRALDDLLNEDHSVDLGALLDAEIELTVNRANQSKEDVNIADTDDDSIISEDSEAFNQTTKLLTFRESYLHAEKFAYESSDGDRDMFWLYLVENLTPLIPAKPEEAEEAEKVTYNPVIDEIMQELHNKLEQANQSNDRLQKLLDEFIPDGAKTDEVNELMQKAQTDQLDFSQYASDLNNKISNALSLDINVLKSIKNDNNNALENNTDPSVVYLEKAQNKINTEANKLKDIIFDQGNMINNLMADLKKAGSSGSAVPQEVLEQLSKLEKSQAESTMCMEVLEMENERLQNLVHELEASAGNEDIEVIKDHVIELQNELETKEKLYKEVLSRCESAEKEIVAIYEKQGKT